MKYTALNSILLALTFQSCTPSLDSAYLQAHEEWKMERMAELKAPDGWLALAGLYWLEPGANTFGSDSSNQVIFPSKAPSAMGVFHLEGDSVRMELADGVRAIEGKSQTETSKATLRLIPGEKPLTFRWEALEWVLLERGGRYGIRLWDQENPAINKLETVPAFPVQAGWVIEATFIPADSGRIVRMQNILGMTIEQSSAGMLEFKKGGKTFRLEALEEPDGYFILFSDATTGKETYSAGRYLHAPFADKAGKTILDFNKAYNPPCIFTPYATCLLPPAANQLDIAVRAGEKSLPHH